MTDRTRLLGRARADLVALPDLVEELARCLTERGDTDTGGSPRKITGSPPPLRLDVLHLVDARRKPGWEGADPRYSVRINEGPERRHDGSPVGDDIIRAVNLAGTGGVAAALESWTRVLADELPEFPDMAERATVRTEAALLVEHWQWITEQQWADELAEDVTGLAGQVRSALGIRREYKPRCRELFCGSVLIPMDGASWYSCPGCGRDYTLNADLEALGQIQSATLAEIAPIVGVPVKTLHRWVSEGAIRSDGRRGNARTFHVDTVRQAAQRLRRAG